MLEFNVFLNEFVVLTNKQYLRGREKQPVARRNCSYCHIRLIHKQETVCSKKLISENDLVTILPMAFIQTTDINRDEKETSLHIEVLVL